MKIAVLKERAEGETRVALTPETAKKFIALGADVAVGEQHGSVHSHDDGQRGALAALAQPTLP